jgi:hypothetical protein
MADFSVSAWGRSIEYRPSAIFGGRQRLLGKFRIRERLHAEFRGEFFDMPNDPNFDSSHFLEMWSYQTINPGMSPRRPFGAARGFVNEAAGCESLTLFLLTLLCPNSA